MTHPLTTQAQALWACAAGLLARHPKRLTALLTALLLGGGGGAYAVASLAPDAADLPVQLITETVQPLAWAPGDDALGTAPLRLYRTDNTRQNDTADTLLKRLGVADPQAAAFLRQDKAARQLLGRAGRQVSAEALDDQRLNKLTARWPSDTEGLFNRLVIERHDKQFSARIETAAFTAATQLASGTIDTSLFAATDDAKIPDHVATQMAEIFSGDIDFHRALRKGDRFSVVYETLQADGEPLRAGRVLSAEFVNKGKSYQAMWFDNPGTAANPAKGGYYTLDGQSLRRAYLASPMAFSRMTSGFAMRMHPILKTMRAHLGVDYGAPTGTPVRTVGDGVVQFAGHQNGFGNVVFIKHSAQNTTVYAHLSRIDVRQGQSVNQSQNIGAVGATGWATGPHLHFEFRVNGQHIDPTVLAKRSESTPVSTAAKPMFERAAAQTRLALQAASDLQSTDIQ